VIQGFHLTRCEEKVVMFEKLCVPLLLIAATVSIHSNVSAQESKSEKRIVPEIKAVRVNPHAPKIDGVLDDEVWQKAKPNAISDFTQSDPDEGKPPSESTRVEVVYDDEALYVAFWCFDSQPDKIAKRLVRRDRSTERDYVTVRLDPYHDHQTGNAFEVSAAGVLRDCRYYDEYNGDMSWDAVWESQVKTYDWGWSAEFKIPFCCLRFNI